MLVVAQHQRKRFGLEGHHEFATLEHRAIRIAEHGQQELGIEHRVRRVPVDVEERRELGGLAVLEHVHPPGDAVRAGQRCEAFEAFGAAEFGVDLRVVDHVVAVQAAGARARDRRAVHMADAQAREVGQQRRGSIEAEIAVQLKAIGRARNHRTGRRARQRGRSRRRLLHAAASRRTTTCTPSHATLIALPAGATAALR
jgi:hypothetical protein